MVERTHFDERLVATFSLITEVSPLTTNLHLHLLGTMVNSANKREKIFLK
jgi:hypothetical protein